MLLLSILPRGRDAKRYTDVSSMDLIMTVLRALVTGCHRVSEAE